jgi:hypothetical protein
MSDTKTAKLASKFDWEKIYREKGISIRDLVHDVQCQAIEVAMGICMEQREQSSGVGYRVACEDIAQKIHALIERPENNPSNPSEKSDPPRFVQ